MYASEVLKAVCTKVAAESITPMMEAVQTSEMLVNLYQSTRRYNPEGSHLQTVPIFTVVNPAH
jgi:hypothetical protein